MIPLKLIFEQVQRPNVRLSLILMATCYSDLQALFSSVDCFGLRAPLLPIHAAVHASFPFEGPALPLGFPWCP